MKTVRGVRTESGFPVGRLAENQERHSCDVCNSRILQPHVQGRRRTTCSDRCRQQLRRMRLAIESVTKRKTPCGPSKALEKITGANGNIDFASEIVYSQAYPNVR